MVQHRGEYKTALARHGLLLALIQKGLIPSALSPGCQLLLPINICSFHVKSDSLLTIEMLRPSLQNQNKRHF
jgi:hypothetical protein